MRISDWSSDVCSSDLLLADIDAVEFLVPRSVALAQHRPAARIDILRNGDVDRIVGDEAPEPIAAPLVVGDHHPCKCLHFGRAAASSEERRVGQEGVRSCCPRVSPYHSKTTK